MAVKLLFAIIVLCVYCTVRTESIHLRDYCDQLVYEKYNRPAFHWNPKTYIINYYKRCLNIDLWVDCILDTRKKPPAGVKVENFEKSFPPELELLVSGIIFCEFELFWIKPNITNCVFNTTMCNRVYQTGDACRDTNKKLICIWGQLSKCGIDRLLPIVKYEYGCLPKSCVKRVNYQWYDTALDFGMGKSPDDCDDSGSATQAKPWTPFVVALGVGVGLTSMIPLLETMMKMMRC